MIYENIRNLCKQKGVSIRQLEIAASLANGTIGKWSGNASADPKISTVEAIADALDVSIDFLVKGDK